MEFTGKDTLVNKTDDDDAREFYRQRSRHLKKKETLKQELVIIGAIYRDLLVPKIMCFVR